MAGGSASQWRSQRGCVPTTCGAEPDPRTAEGPSLRTARTGRVMLRNSDATAETSRAACMSARWISAELFARSAWYNR